jgi:hypothetical protein
MSSNFPPVKSEVLELALQQWADWGISLNEARERLMWSPMFSEEDRIRWVHDMDQDKVWNLALAIVDQLKLPRLFAGYWIACLVSPYDPEDAGTYWKISNPEWVEEKMRALQDTLLFPELPFGNKRYGGTIYSAGGASALSKRSLPLSYVSLSVPDPPSFVTIHIPSFLIPGLIRNPLPLVEPLREFDNKFGKHPLSAILQGVGRPTGGGWAKKMIEGVETQQLRPLYKFLIQSEYSQEVVNGLSPEQVETLANSAGEVSNDTLALGFFAEKELGKKEQIKIKSRVRKRVSAWFKSVNRWPLPEESR